MKLEDLVSVNHMVGGRLRIQTQGYLTPETMLETIHLYEKSYLLL